MGGVDEGVVRGDLGGQWVGEEGVGEGGGAGEGAGGLGVAKGVKGGDARGERGDVVGEAADETGAAGAVVVWVGMRGGGVGEVDGGGELLVAAEGAGLADLGTEFRLGLGLV